MSDAAETEPFWVEPLYAAAIGRPRPEEIAKLVLSLFPTPPHAPKWWKRASAQGSTMSDRFASPEPLTHSANVLAMLIGETPLSPEETLGPPMDRLLAQGRKTILAPDGPLDFRHGRLNGEGRQTAGLKLSRRQYNRLFRLIRFLEDEKAGNDRYAELCSLMVGAKSGILRYLPRESFARDQTSAIFIAYMASRLSMRSKFTIEPQARAFDDLGDALLKDLFRSKTTEWFAVAHAFPRADVLVRLSEPEKLNLVAIATEQMLTAVRLLERLATENDIDFQKGFVVRKGQDSSAWNAAAGAYNKARESWLSLTTSLGFEIASMLPGKVPRLMAADVVAWQHMVGQSAHPDEQIAVALPRPWDVLLHGVECPASLVAETCRQVGIDPVRRGWTAPLERERVETWQPTPELVHGVVIRDPQVAAAMRRLGWFSGPAKWERENYAEKNRL